MAAKQTGSKKLKGLQLTTAENAAYNKAYAAAATKARTRLALASAAQNLRKYRLQAAHGMVKAARAAQTKAQTAAIAAQATHRTYVQSRLAHQNSALQARIEHNMATHAIASGRAQYVAAGEKAYAHHTVMATVTTKQATTIEAKIFKTAKKASKSVLPKTKYKPGPNSKAIAAAGKAAGAKAAVAVARTAPNYGNVPHRQSTALAMAMYEAHTRTKATSKYAPVEWLGDEVTPNCVITAIANHLLHVKGLKISQEALDELYEACDPEPTIEEVLWRAWEIGWPGEGARLHDYKPSPFRGGDALRSLVIGFAVKCDDGVTRDHAALAISGDKVVSWGKISNREAEVEEAWYLEWQ